MATQEQRITILESQMRGVKGELDAINGKLKSIEEKFDDRLNAIVNAFHNNRREIVDIKNLMLARFDRLDRKVDILERRVSSLEKRMDTMERRLDTMERRLDTMERRLDGVERQICSMQNSIDAVTRHIMGNSLP